MSDDPQRRTVKAWVWKLKEPPSMKVLLLALADHLSDEGLAWPALETLADECCISRGTVINQIDKAVARGYITKEARSRKGQLGQTSNGYRFTCWPEAECNISTLAEYKNDTQVEAEFNSSTGQSTKIVRPEYKNYTPRTLPQSLPQDDPLSTSPTVLSEPPEVTARAATVPKPRKAKPEDPPDLKAVCDLWTELGLGHISQTARTGLRELVAIHGKDWTETGLRRASEGNVKWPVSWCKSVIPSLKREQAQAPGYRNGSGPPGTLAGRKGPLSAALVLTDDDDAERGPP